MFLLQVVETRGDDTIWYEKEYNSNSTCQNTFGKNTEKLLISWVILLNLKVCSSSKLKKEIPNYVRYSLRNFISSHCNDKIWSAQSSHVVKNQQILRLCESKKHWPSDTKPGNIAVFIISINKEQISTRC